MFTERGWAVLGGALALFVLWVLFGESELGVAAFTLGAASVIGLTITASARPRLDIDRHISPIAVHEGDYATVTLSLRNRAPRPLNHVAVTEEVIGLGTAEFAVASIPAGAEVTASYRILCQPRGVYTIGATDLTVGDPMGLTSRSVSMGPTTELVVYPTVETLSGFPAVRGRNLALTAQRPEHNQRGGEDFYTLREYRQGDDLRRVHWPSSARRDQMMIRQLETPWQARSLVVFDVRAGAYDTEAAFEKAVSGAATVVHHLQTNGYSSDLWAGSGLIPADTYALPMETLAAISPRKGINLARLAGSIRQSGSGGVLILVTGKPDEDLFGLYRSLSSTHPTAILMTTAGRATATSAFSRTGVISVEVKTNEPWATAWAMATGGAWRPASAD